MSIDAADSETARFGTDSPEARLTDGDSTDETADQRWTDLGAFIREQRRSGHLSLRKLSEMAGVSNPYLSQIERGLRHPSAEILQQIANALQISAETLYIRAGILEPRDPDADLVVEIRRDPHISEAQKRTLIHIYRSFRTGGEVTESSSSAA